MGVRRDARICALQILYQLEAQNQPNHSAVTKAKTRAELTSIPVRPRLDDAVVACEKFFANFSVDAKAIPHAEALVRGLAMRWADVDNAIDQYSQKWRLMRMAAVDRNVLRLCTYELMYVPDVPTRVILDEGIEMAKQFGSEQSASFVNGVLHSIASGIRPNNDLREKPAETTHTDSENNAEEQSSAQKDPA